MPVSEAMKNHLGGNTSLGVFLTIESKSGDVLNVWNGTRNKKIGSDTFYAYPVAPSRLQQANGLKADNFELTAIYSGLFTSATIRAKKWMGARVTYQVRDYKLPALGYATRRVAYIGQTNSGKFAANPELKSLSSKLQQETGLSYEALCDVDEFGDARCGVDLTGMTATGYSITTPAHVTASPNRQQLTLAFDSPIKPGFPGVTFAPDDLYERGKITILSGANEGAEMMISANEGNALTLYLPLFANIAPGTLVSVITGCNRKIAVCRDLYNNADSNRSFFMLPGRSKALNFPE